MLVRSVPVTFTKKKDSKSKAPNDKLSRDGIQPLATHAFGFPVSKVLC